MPPPKRIVVSPHTYDVREEKGLSSAAGVNGACGVDMGNILYDPQQSFTQMKETILHECLHALWNQGGITIDNKSVSDDDEENIIKVLAPRFLALLRDNPKLVEYLEEK